MYSITHVVLSGSPNMQRSPVNTMKEKALIGDDWGTLGCLISFCISPHSFSFWNFHKPTVVSTASLFSIPRLNMKHLNFWRSQLLRLPNLGRLTLPPWGKRAPNLFLKINPRSPDSVFKVTKLSFMSCKKFRVRAYAVSAKSMYHEQKVCIPAEDIHTLFFLGIRNSSRNKSAKHL